jgi:hypothetical protein
VPNLEFQFLVGHIHLVASTDACTEAIQTMRSFLKEGGNDVFAQGNTSTVMEGNRNIEQRDPLGKILTRKNNNYFACCFSTTLLFPYHYLLL